MSNSKRSQTISHNSISISRQWQKPVSICLWICLTKKKLYFLLYRVSHRPSTSRKIWVHIQKVEERIYMVRSDKTVHFFYEFWHIFLVHFNRIVSLDQLKDLIIQTFTDFKKPARLCKSATPHIVRRANMKDNAHASSSYLEYLNSFDFLKIFLFRIFGMELNVKKAKLSKIEFHDPIRPYHIYFFFYFFWIWTQHLRLADGQTPCIYF